MPKKTNLDEVKKLAIAFLYTDIEETEMSPMIISHPFFTSAFCGVKAKDGQIEMVNILASEEDLERARQSVKDSIQRSKDAFGVMLCLRDPYTLTFVKYTKDFLSDEDFGKMLSYAWVVDENANDNVNVSARETERLFKHAKPEFLMTEEERKVLEELPDEFPVYRGANEMEPPIGFSWSLKREVAEWFAKRFGEKDTQVYQAVAYKVDVLAYFDAREEFEVVINYKNLRDITIVS